MNRNMIICVLALGTLLACSSGGGNGGNPSPSIVSIAVTPANPSIAPGATQQFTATGTYSDNSTKDLTSTATWTSSKKSVATIDAAGLATSICAGSTVITATSGTVVGNAAMTVRDFLLESPFGFHPASVAKPGYNNNGYGDASNIGVTWTREGVYAYWFLVQPDLADPTYVFTQYDTQWSRVPAGMNILANIAPQGPIDEGRCLANSYFPVDEQKYVDFVKAVVRRYGGDSYAAAGLTAPIKYWQVGNEPNNVKSGFADLQRITYIAIKEACPGCTVLIGGVPGMPPVADYLSNFDQHYKPILDALGGKYVDVMDFHWYGNATGDYRGAKEVYDHIRGVLDADGFPAIPFWIAEMGAYSGDPLPAPISNPPVDYALQTERQQAIDYFKRFVYPLSIGVKKIFPAFGLMEGLKGDGGYFDYTGLIYNGSGTGDLGLGVKKLGYYTYPKMTEMLEGSDWNGIQTIQESGNVYIYRFTKNNAPIYVAWWDYFNDPSYTPGKTIQVSLSGLQGISAVVTEAVPKFASGAEMTDFTTAFNTVTRPIINNTATFDLGDSPVFVEIQPFIYGLRISSYDFGHDELLESYFQTAKDLGMSCIKIPVTQDRFDYTQWEGGAAKYGPLADLSRKYGLSIVPMFDNQPLGKDYQANAQFACFVSAFIKKYAKSMNIVYTEFQNEPDTENDGSGDSIDPPLWKRSAADLVMINNAAYDKIKADYPDIQVGSPGFISGSKEHVSLYTGKFLTAYFAAGPKFDFFALHDYPKSYSYVQGTVAGDLASEFHTFTTYRNLLDLNGHGEKPILATEGYTDTPSSETGALSWDWASEGEAATLWVETYLHTLSNALRNNVIGKIISGVRTTGTTGLINSAGEVKRNQYYLVRYLTAFLRKYPVYSRHIAGDINSGGPWIEELRDDSGKKAWVAFNPLLYTTTNDALMPSLTQKAIIYPQSIMLSVGNAGTVSISRVVSKTVNTETLSVQNGAVPLTLEDNPVLVEILP